MKKGEIIRNKGGGVSHYGLAIYITKVSEGKRRNMKIQIFLHTKI
jgi:hypothetical protein